MMRNRSLNCLKKFIRWYGLGQKVVCTSLNGPHRSRDIGMPADEYDRQARTEFAQTLLQLRTAQFWYSNVEEDAARDTFARQAIQQGLSRSIDRDLVTSSLQTTFHRSPEGRVVVDYMHEPLHGSVPRDESQGIKQLLPEHVNFQENNSA